MRRGDLVLVALKGDYGKARPGLIIQADLFEAHPSVVVLPFTSHLDAHQGLRIAVEPTPENGLRKESLVMIDKPHVVEREKIGAPIGRLAPDQMTAVDRALALFLGFA